MDFLGILTNDMFVPRKRVLLLETSCAVWIPHNVFVLAESRQMAR